MRILIAGGTGTIGSAVVHALEARHEVLLAGRTQAKLPVDIADQGSIARLYERVGTVDAVVSTAGHAAFRPLLDLTDADWRASLDGKLMGQIDLVRLGMSHVRDGGSFTLSGGLLSRQPLPGSPALSTVNAALEGFARAAALELPRGLRINVVAPSWVRETLIAMGRDPAPGVPAAEVAAAYVRSIEGGMSGEVLDVAKRTQHRAVPGGIAVHGS